MRLICGLQAPKSSARQSSRATEQTSRQSADSWFWTHPVQVGPRDIATAPSSQCGWIGLGESCLHIQEHLEQRVAETQAQRALQALYFLPLPSLNPTALSKDATVAVKLN